jgi:hypothetical protein
MAFATPDIHDRLVCSRPQPDHDKGSGHLPIITTFSINGYQTAHEERYLLKQLDPDIFKAALQIHLPEVPPSGLSNDEIDRISEGI